MSRYGRFTPGNKPLHIVQETRWLRKTSPSPGLFSLVLCFYFIRTCVCLHCPRFCLLPLLYNTRNTNILAPGGIRNRNPTKRAAADPCLRPLNHWNRHSIPGPYSPQLVAIATELTRPRFTQKLNDNSSYVFLPLVGHGNKHDRLPGKQRLHKNKRNATAQNEHKWWPAPRNF